MSAVSVRDARKYLRKLVDAAEQGETISITRRGKRVARLVPAAGRKRRGLPSLAAFRSSISVKGKSLSQTVIQLRAAERY